MRQYAIISKENIDKLDWSKVKEQKETVRYNNSGTHYIVSFDAVNSDSVLNLSEEELMSLEVTHELMNTPEWLQEDLDI